MTGLLFSMPPLVDIALLILRFIIGAMFAMSGFFKLTDIERKTRMMQSLNQAGVPTTLTTPLSLLELVGGLAVLFGFLTALGAWALLGISLGALITITMPKAEGNGIHKLENILYAPEAILAGALLVLLAIGAGDLSLDAMLR